MGVNPKFSGALAPAPYITVLTAKLLLQLYHSYLVPTQAAEYSLTELLNPDLLINTVYSSTCEG